MIDEPAVKRKIIVRLIPFLFVLYIVAYLDRVNVSFAQLQMAKSLHFGDAVYGFGSGIFFFGYFLFEVPSNLLLERYGARQWIGRIMLTWGVIAMLMVFTHTPNSFYTFRFVLGMAEAGFFPGMIFYLTKWFTSEERAHVISLFMTAVVLSNVIGGPVSGAILQLDQTGGLAGWQWLFLLEGFPAVILAFVVWFRMADGPADAKWLTGDEQTWLLLRLEEDRRRRGTASHKLIDAFTNPMVWLFALLYFVLVVAMYGYNLWLPQIVKAYTHTNNFVVGLITAIPYIVAAFGMVWIGQHSDRTGERRLHLALPAFLGAACLELASQIQNPYLIMAVLSVAALGIWGTLGPFWSQPTAILGGTAAAGGLAFINSVGNLGGFVGPYLVGIIKQHTHGFQGGMMVLGVSLFLGGLLAFAIKKPAPDIEDAVPVRS